MPNPLRALLPVLALLASAASLFGASLTPGNLVIYRMGDGTAALAATGTAVFLDEYTTAGVLVQSIPVPTTTVGAQRRLVCSGTATTEGFLTRSTDGQFVVISGYDAALGATVTTSTSAVAPRVIGRLAANGTLDTTTALTDAISGGNPRSAASTNGTDLWLSGTSTGGGIRYATFGAMTSTSLAATPTNLRVLGIFGGQLYTSTQSGAFRLATIGTGTPTTTGQTITNLPGFPTATGSPQGFFFADLDAGVAGMDTVYVADDGGTIQKYSLVGGNWTANGTIALTTARGLTGSVSGTTVTLYATARTTLRTLTDTSGYNATITGTVTTLATAATNTAMQGVAFVPVPGGPNLSINDVSLNEGNAGTTSFTFTVSLSAPAGPGGVTFDIATADNTALQPGDYTQKSLNAQTIPAGSSTYSFTVLVNGDLTPETNETFFVDVTNVTGANVTDGQGQGTIVNDDAAPNLTINDVSLNEGNAGTTTFTFTVSLSAPAGAGGVTFDIATANNTATQPSDYTQKTLTGQTIPAGSSTYTFDVLVNGDTTPEVDETFFVNVTNVTNAIVTDGQGQGTIVNDDLSRIHDVQGNGAATPIPGATVSVEGVVVASFQGTGKLGGFFLEEEDADADADPATSEGIFIFCGGCPTAVAEGQRVKATGTVSEFSGMTEISATTAGSVVITNAGNNLAQVTPAAIDLPIAGVVDDYYEAREGMKVTFVDSLSVSEYFELGRYGQIILYEGGRPRQFTEFNTPSVAGNAAWADTLSRRKVILDDDNNAMEWYLTTSSPPGPADGLQFVYHPRANGGFSVGTQGVDFFRGGDLVNGLTGVLSWDFPGLGASTWRIRPTSANPATFTVANPRPATPPATGGAIHAVGMNLLNYFTTIDTTSSNNTGPCAPSGTLDCRGADSTAELNRQRARAALVICTLNADVYGFAELENTTPSTSINDLLGAVNPLCGGAHPYAFANTGGTLGTDAIRVQQIYRTGIVSPVGSPQSDLDPIHSRPPTAQTYDVVDAANPAFGKRFTVVINHFKSKGSSAGLPGDADTGDGAGASNATRTAQANRLLTWINGTVVPAAGDPDVLLLGDFNAYAKEDPINALIGGGYTDLETLFHGANAYSYLFDGQLGHLDYGFASSSLLPQITGADAWHINADEVDLFDYNDEIRDSPGEATFEEKPDGSALVPPRVVFQPGTPYRASDHDPVVVGIFQVADLSITKTDGVTTATPGGSVTYTITASNAGPSNTSATVADTFPASLTCTWTCVGAGGGTCTASGSGNVNDSVNLPVGGSVTYTASCSISAAAAGSLSNTATVTSSASSDPTPGNNSATDTDTLTATANLGITKNDGITAATPGGSTIYTIVVSNAGPSATMAGVFDTFPASLTCTWTCTGAGGGTCTASGAGNINEPVTLPAGGSVTFTTPCSISASATGSLVNTASVAGVATDPVPGNNSATDTDTLVGQADIALAKSVDNASPGMGSNVVFTVVATNNGPSNATGVAVNDLLPVGLAFVSATPSVGSYANGTGVWTIGSLANGASATLAITATVNRLQAMVNQASKSAEGEVDARGSNNTATVRLNGTPLIDIQVSESVDNSTPGMGQDVFFLVTARNAGPATATGVILNSSLPAGVSFVSSTPSQGTYTPGTGAWSVGTLASGASATLTVRMTNTVATPVVQTFTKTASTEMDLVTGNNAASVVLNPTAPQVDLGLTKITMQEPAAAGLNFSYVIEVTNLSAPSATGVVVTDTLPAGVLLVSAASSQGSCTGTTTVTCNLGTLIGGGSATINLVVMKTVGGTVANTAMVTGTESDPNMANNTNAATTTPVTLLGFEIE